MLIHLPILINHQEVPSPSLSPLSIQSINKLIRSISYTTHKARESKTQKRNTKARVVMEAALVLNSAVALAIAFLLGHLYKTVWLKCETMRRKLRMQGIKGPPPSILYGNLPEMQKIQANAAKPSSTGLASDIVAHDYTSTLFPYFEQWRKEYGKLPFWPPTKKKKKRLYINFKFINMLLSLRWWRSHRRITNSLVLSVNIHM